MIDKGNMLNEIYEIAFENEKEHGNCTQSTISAFDELFEIVDDDVFKSGHGLAGGAALKTEGTCGALSGGIMVLGILLGRNKEEYHGDDVSKIDQYDPYRRLLERFVQEFGSCRCKKVQRELFGRSFDFWDEKDSKEFGEAENDQNNCSEVVGKTAVLTLKILMEEMDEEEFEQLTDR